MRTTVTLDPDLGVRLKQLAREREVSFKEVLNTTIRAGLEASRPHSRPFVVHARSLGTHTGIDLDRALRMADQLEDEAITRKLELGK